MMKNKTEKLNQEITQLMKFYTRKSRESGGGSFYIPVVRGRKLPAIWARNKADLSKWARHERFVIDQLIPLR